MNNKSLAPLLIALTFALTACASHKGSEGFGGSGDNGNGGSETLPTTDVLHPDSGIAENNRPEGINPDKDVNYQILAADTVYFAFDASIIPAAERGKLEQVSEWFKANPGHELFLAGHADKRGTPEYNLALGERRALAVREYLVGLGLPAGSLYTNSYGANRPAVVGDTEEAYARNRRVEVGVIVRP